MKIKLKNEIILDDGKFDKVKDLRCTNLIELCNFSILNEINILIIDFLNKNYWPLYI